MRSWSGEKLLTVWPLGGGVYPWKRREAPWDSRSVSTSVPFALSPGGGGGPQASLHPGAGVWDYALLGCPPQPGRGKTGILVRRSFGSLQSRRLLTPVWSSERIRPRRGLRGLRLCLQRRISSGDSSKTWNSGSAEALQEPSPALWHLPWVIPGARGPFLTPSFRWDPWSLPGVTWSSRDLALACPSSPA